MTVSCKLSGQHIPARNWNEPKGLHARGYPGRYSLQYSPVKEIMNVEPWSTSIKLYLRMKVKSTWNKPRKTCIPEEQKEGK